MYMMHMDRLHPTLSNPPLSPADAPLLPYKSLSQVLVYSFC